jgi:hypothetical protein
MYIKYKRAGRFSPPAAPPPQSRSRAGPFPGRICEALKFQAWFKILNPKPEKFKLLNPNPRFFAA